MNAISRRMGLIGAALAAVAIAAAGCGSAGDDDAGGSTQKVSGSGNGPTLTIWHEFSGSEGKGMDALLDAYTKTGGKIKQRVINSDDFFAAIRTGMAGRNPPDLLQYEGYQQTRDFAKAGKLTDVTDIYDGAKDKFALTDSARRACEYQGKMYCIPMAFNRLLLFYNTKMLKDKGIAPPKTWDEFLAAGAKFAKSGVTPAALGNKNSWPATHWLDVLLLQRCGAETVYKAIDGNGAKWDDPCFTQAAADLDNLRAKGFFPKGVASDDENAMYSEFLSGKSPFMITGTWFITSWADTPPSFDVGISNIPTIAGSAHPKDILAQMGAVVAVPTRAAHKQEALKFLKFLTTEPAGVAWDTSEGDLSPLKGVNEQGHPATRKVWDLTQDETGTVPFLETELPPSVGEDALYNGVSSLVAGKSSPSAVTKRLAGAAAKASD